MMLMTNKKYDALMQTLARIEHKLDAKEPAKKPRGGAELNGVHKKLPLSEALRQVMLDGTTRTVGQACHVVKMRGLCRHAVKHQSVNALLSKMFLKGELSRPEAGQYQYKG